MERIPAHTVGTRGFTLVEMLVVLAIITIVTTITLSGQATFNRSLLLTDTTYTLALSLREMQTLGLSSRSYNGVSNTGYGGHFELGTPGSYLLFADIHKASPAAISNCPVGVSGSPDEKPGNCVYSASDGILQTYTFSRGFYIERFCGTAPGTSGTRYCSTDSDPLTALDVVFVRSNTTDAIITGQRSGSREFSKAEIYISSPDGSASRAICISQVGQISVAYSLCP